MDAFSTTNNEYIERRKTLIRQTWRAVEFGMGEKVTVDFNERLLSQCPELIPLFAGTDMKVLSHKLYGIIKLAVHSLDEIESLVPLLEKLGRRHATVYGLDRSHYRVFTSTFIEEEKFHQPHRVAGTYHQERGFNKVAAAILILDIDMPNYSSPIQVSRHRAVKFPNDTKVAHVVYLVPSLVCAALMKSRPLLSFLVAPDEIPPTCPCTKMVCLS
eukprot:scaffold29618_cov183-Amphora_coffeaeformis.AAC.5